MLSEGKTYAPISMKIVADGKYTRYTMPLSHRAGSTYILDGYVYVLAEGTYGSFREGDEIKIKHIKGINIRKWGGKPYFSMYADIEYKSAFATKPSVNDELLEELPEDLI